jgi:hypothetical protein
LLQTEVEEGIRKHNMFDTLTQLSQHIANMESIKNDSLASGAEQEEQRDMH